MGEVGAHAAIGERNFQSVWIEVLSLFGGCPGMIII